MTHDKATLRPWEIFRARTGRSTFANTTYVRAHKTIGEPAVCKVLCQHGHGEQEANAALIVSAVNSHDAAIELARWAVSIDKPEENPYLIKLAREVLRLAEVSE